MPVPVGALTSTGFPAAIAGHASSCTFVAFPNVSANQPAVGSEKILRMSSAIVTSMQMIFLIIPYFTLD